MSFASILHFSTSDVQGGSARSANRIHNGIRERGLKSRMFVGFRFGNDSEVKTVSSNNLLKFMDKFANYVGNWTGWQYYFVPSSLTLHRHHWIRDADLVQLYNIHGGYFSYGLLQKIGLSKPLIWRMSDLWPITGHCAYPGNCERWMIGCGECPNLYTYPPIKVDRSATLFNHKAMLYRNLNLTVVAPSSWTESKARKSPLFKNFPIIRIPNGLDDKPYLNCNPNLTRVKLGIPTYAKVILFSSHILDNNPRKGGNILIKALQQLGMQENWHLVLMGKGGKDWVNKIPIPVHLLGFIDDTDKIAEINAIADVVIIPSIEDNLPNTLIEALASKKVVIASDAGGLMDGVIDNLTGFITPIGNFNKLANRIKLVLENDEMRLKMASEAMNLFQKEFSKDTELDRYIKLYNSILKFGNI